jgi:hypothetical protein
MHVWHTWVLRQVGDVCAVVQFRKLDGKHLSIMLSSSVETQRCQEEAVVETQRTQHASATFS